jgi:hypothetical protein
MSLVEEGMVMAVKNFETKLEQIDNNNNNSTRSTDSINRNCQK